MLGSRATLQITFLHHVSGFSKLSLNYYTMYSLASQVSTKFSVVGPLFIYKMVNNTTAIPAQDFQSTFLRWNNWWGLTTPNVIPTWKRHLRGALLECWPYYLGIKGMKPSTGQNFCANLHVGIARGYAFISAPLENYFFTYKLDRPCGM